MNTTQVGNRLVLRHEPMVHQTINVIGCGGIGARIIPALSKMVPSQTNIVLWDDDVVEVKNLLRQNFALPDVGKRKAEVLAQRYTTALARCSARVERWNDYHHGMPEGIVISAVDDWATRKALMTQTYGLVIDCGNDGLRGQVLLGGSVSNTPVRTIEMFPELIEEQPPQPCDLGDTQTVLANQMAAVLALNYVDILLNGRGFSHIGMMFSLPHGIWEIPAFAQSNRWRDHDTSTTIRVFPGWTKGGTNNWQPDRQAAAITELDEKVDGWTPEILAVVENALYRCGADRNCGCVDCVRLMIPALTGLQLTSMPPPLVGGWGPVDTTVPPNTAGRGLAHRRRSRRYECENCGDTFTAGEAEDNGTHDSTRWCGENCSDEWMQAHEEEPEPDDDDHDNDEEPDARDEDTEEAILAQIDLLGGVAREPEPVAVVELLTPVAEWVPEPVGELNQAEVERVREALTAAGVVRQPRRRVR